MEMTMIEQLPDDLCKSMMRDLVKNQMFREADALEAKWMELQHSDSVQMMQCPNGLKKKIDFGYAICGWCHRALGAYAHINKVGGDSSLAQDLATVPMMTGNRPHDQQSQTRFNEFFVKEVRARSAWGQKAKLLKKQYTRLTNVPDWRDPSRVAQYTSIVHRWDNDRT